MAELTENDNYDSLLVVTATDLSENPFVENALKDFKTGKTNNNYEFIFDNRDPVASIVVDEPTQKVDGVAYYSGEFKGHITVDEANFVGDLLYKDLKLEIQEDDLQDTKYDYEFDSETEAWDNNGTNDIWTNSFTLKKEGSPLVRYRTRDITYLYREECECGRTTIKMHRLLGRVDDMLIIKGVNVFPSQVEQLLIQIQGLTPNYQIILTRGDNHLDEMEIQVEMDEETFSDETKDLESLKNKIYNSVKSKLGIYAKIKLVEPRTIARSEGKAKRVIDNRVI